MRVKATAEIPSIREFPPDRHVSVPNKFDEEGAPLVQTQISIDFGNCTWYGTISDAKDLAAYMAESAIEAETLGLAAIEQAFARARAARA